ncbi:MAG: glutamine-hydrolyzing carbamoyl-phosphate synthase small subunit [Gammaproteobacteria bacterium]
MTVPAILALEDGTLFRGRSIGAAGSTVGEVVFNTAMSGYQEILTDPSYSKQLVTLTYPHIGNTGVNLDDQESEQVQAGGLIIRDLPILPSNWRMEESLPDYLARQNIVAISDIDTRRLTRHLRTVGALNGCIMTGNYDDDVAIGAAKKFPGLKGMDLAKVVSTTSQYEWSESTWSLSGDTEPVSARFRVVAYDFGVKRNILRLLVSHGCHVTVVPAETPASEVLDMAPDGVFLSNGPGDPEPCDYAIKAIKEVLEAGVPTFGICLGHQLLALASGARTEKMKFGHHGANHPVQELSSGKVMISSQNHGFAVNQDSLPDTLKATHVSLFDQTLQGMSRTDTPAFGFQGHPEASPGPHDLRPLFERFIQLMSDRKK